MGISAEQRMNEAREMLELGKGFVEWRDSLPNSHWARYDLSACKLGWDAARQYWLDEAIKVANRKLRGITPECTGYNKCSTEIVEKLQALKEAKGE